MGIYEPVIAAGVIPAVVCAVVSLAARYWPGRAGVAIAVRRPVAAFYVVAPAAGFVAGFLALEGWPGLPPRDDWARIVVVGAGCGVWAAVVASFETLKSVGIRVAIGVGFSAAAAWYLTPAWVDGRLVPLIGLGASTFVVWRVLDGLGARGSTVTEAVIGGVAALGLAAVLVLTGNAKLGLLAGSVAAVSGVQAVVRMPAGKPSGSGVATIAGGLVPGLAYVGHYNDFSGASWWVFAVAAAAPAAAAVGEMPFIRERSGPWTRFAGRLAPVMIACVGSVAGAARHYEPA